MDILKVDVDLDAHTAFNGFLLGVGGGIPKVFDVWVDLGDADVGVFIGMTRKQTCKTRTAKIDFNFPIPKKVETFSGSDTREVVYLSIFNVGDEMRISHPSTGLEMTPEFGSVWTQNLKLKETILTQVLSLKMINLDFGDAVPLALSLERYADFEDAFPLADLIAFAKLFDESFELMGLNTIAGQSFSLVGENFFPSAVPLPASR